MFKAPPARKLHAVLGQNLSQNLTANFSRNFPEGLSSDFELVRRAAGRLGYWMSYKQKGRGFQCYQVSQLPTGEAVNGGTLPRQK